MYGNIVNLSEIIGSLGVDLRGNPGSPKDNPAEVSFLGSWVPAFHRRPPYRGKRCWTPERRSGIPTPRVACVDSAGSVSPEG